MEAIILAGGMGTRLRSVVKSVPKPLADINGRPFITFILDQLIAAGASRILLSIGYLAQDVKRILGDSYRGSPLEYVIEEEPLGTGGAIRRSLASCHDESVLVLNGDSIINSDLSKFWEFHQASQADISLILKPLENFDRYGNVIIDESGRVKEFQEKRAVAIGNINTGVYALRRALLLERDFPEKFSFENDFLTPECARLKVLGYRADGYFIDIGIPEDYQRACDELSSSL